MHEIIKSIERNQAAKNASRKRRNDSLIPLSAEIHSLVVDKIVVQHDEG